MCERELDNGSGSSFSLNRPFIGCFAKSFHQNGLFLRTEALGKSFINDWNKQMHALFCSGSESVCLYCCWMARFIVVENTEGMDRKGFTHSLWKTFPLLKHHCLSSKCENVFMLQCCAALPLIFLSSSVCPHCLPLTRSLGWAQLEI